MNEPGPDITEICQCGHMRINHATNGCHLGRCNCPGFLAKAEPTADQLAALCDFVQNSVHDHRRHCACASCEMVAAARNLLWATRTKANAVPTVTMPRELAERFLNIAHCVQFWTVRPNSQSVWYAKQAESDLADILYRK